MKIGIAVSTSKTQYYINQAYVNYVLEAGYEPILILPGSDIQMFVEIIDGLIMPGGIDLDPIYYGDDNYNSYGVDPIKDDFERDLFHAVRYTGKPIFGICRGFQLIIRELMLHDEEASEFMSFSTHIDSHAQTSNQQLDRSICSHFVDYRPKVLYRTGNDQEIESIPVNSMHHQCLVFSPRQKDVVSVNGFCMAAWTNRGLKANKRHPYQTVCEAFRIRDWNAPILAVQWHPEELRDTELIRNFFGSRDIAVDGAS